MTRTVVAFTVLVVVCTGLFGSTQDPQPKPTFKSSVDLVHFDVSVLDKLRHPVRGLTAADFTVLEDGKPQPISTFLAVDVPPPPPPPPAKWMREVSPDVGTNEPAQNPEGRLFVLLIDDALMPPDPGATKTAKKIAHSVVDRLSPTDQLAVVFTFASGNAQAFTTDRKKLFAAIDSLQTGKASHMLGWDNVVEVDRPPVITSGPPPPGRFFVPAVDSDEGLRLGSLRTLQMVAETLIAAPQRRKALIFVSPGVTVDIESDARPVKVPAGRSDPGTAIREANHQLARDMTEVFRQMARANVTVYSVDPCGLGGLEAYIAGVAGGLPALRGIVAPPPPFYNWLAPSGPPAPSSLAHHAAMLDMDFLVAAATNTGGRAIVNTNDFDPGLDGIFEENASYYLIGYAKPDKDTPGSLHTVTVKVNKPGVTVRTRSGYEIERDRPSAPKKSNGLSPADLAMSLTLGEAAARPVADGALPLQIALAPVAVSGRAAGSAPGATQIAPNAIKQDSAVTIVLGLHQPAVAARTPQTIDLQIGVYTPDGRRVGALQRQTATFTLVPGGDDFLRYEVLTQVALAPGRYEVRVAAHRGTDNLNGSVYTDVVVPDFSNAPLSLSGVWLDASPGPSAVPRDALTSMLPVVPTASRNFKASDDVTAFFRVYQGGDAPLAAVLLTVRIVNDQDVMVATATGTLGVERFDLGTRAADHRFLMPLRDLPAGRYLLSFDVTRDQAAARRDVVFTVR